MIYKHKIYDIVAIKYFVIFVVKYTVSDVHVGLQRLP